MVFCNGKCLLIACSIQTGKTCAEIGGEWPQNDESRLAAACRSTLELRGRKLERAMGLEPTTPTLARSCSTTELHPRPDGDDCSPATADLCQMPTANATVSVRSEPGKRPDFLLKSTRTGPKQRWSIRFIRRPPAFGVGTGALTYSSPLVEPAAEQAAGLGFGRASFKGASRHSKEREVPLPIEFCGPAAI
jgi:hypothetical protein